MGLVTVTAFEDLACGDCADYAHMLDSFLAPKFGRRVAFIHKDFPLRKHEWAYNAAVAARFLAVRSPAVAHRFRRFCMGERHQISRANLARHFLSFAKDAGLEAPSFADVTTDAASRTAVDHDIAEGLALGVDRTPTVFVGGVVFVELFDVTEVVEAIETALMAAPSGSTVG